MKRIVEINGSVEQVAKELEICDIIYSNLPKALSNGPVYAIQNTNIFVRLFKKYHTINVCGNIRFSTSQFNSTFNWDNSLMVIQSYGSGDDFGCGEHAEAVAFSSKEAAEAYLNGSDIDILGRSTPEFYVKAI